MIKLFNKKLKVKSPKFGENEIMDQKTLKKEIAKD